MDVGLKDMIVEPAAANIMYSSSWAARLFLIR